MNMRSQSAPPIQCRGLTKRFGSHLAVDGLTFDVPPGAVTGFIGANGAGKTTTMRMILGLVEPSAGDALVMGLPYASHPSPRRLVGAAVDGPGAHPSRTAFTHLSILATAAGIPSARAEELLHVVGLADAARQRVGSFSMGMLQRLALAGALLGDPPVLILDEPVNGLDPPGILWMRSLLRRLADEGRTILVSSHLLSELAEIADRVVIIDRGRLVVDDSLGALLDGRSGSLEQLYFDLIGAKEIAS
jgi:ABC-2 type transport system ATP-binding protein